MKTFTIRTKDTHKTLFSGQFETMKNCLKEAVKQGIYLKNANFKHINLTNANLDDAHLDGADLSFSNLTGANLSESHMSHTVWKSASLYNTCLAQANLKHADLRYAGFGATDLAGADLSFARLSLHDSAKINLFDARIMHECVFQDNRDTQHITSTPPVAITGLLNCPILFVNDFVIIGNSQFRVEDFPLSKLKQKIKKAS